MFFLAVCQSDKAARAVLAVDGKGNHNFCLVGTYLSPPCVMYPFVPVNASVASAAAGGTVGGGGGGVVAPPGAGPDDDMWATVPPPRGSFGSYVAVSEAYGGPRAVLWFFATNCEVLGSMSAPLRSTAACEAANTTTRGACAFPAVPAPATALRLHTAFWNPSTQYLSWTDAGFEPLYDAAVTVWGALVAGLLANAVRVWRSVPHGRAGLALDAGMLAVSAGFVVHASLERAYWCEMREGAMVPVTNAGPLGLGRGVAGVAALAAFYSGLLLIAKGWHVTRPWLRPGEWLHCVVLAAAYCVGACTYNGYIGGPRDVSTRRASLLVLLSAVVYTVSYIMLLYSSWIGFVVTLSALRRVARARSCMRSVSIAAVARSVQRDLAQQRRLGEEALAVVERKGIMFMVCGSALRVVRVPRTCVPPGFSASGKFSSLLSASTRLRTS